MKTTPEKPVKELLIKNHSLLPDVLRKVQQIEKINHLFKSCLDAALTEHCRVANIRDNCLIVEVDSSAWATRLRYHLPNLLCNLKTKPELQDLKTIDYYILPVTDKQYNARQSYRQPSLSTESAHIIEEAANNISDSDLQTALKRLARTLSGGIRD